MRRMKERVWSFFLVGEIKIAVKFALGDTETELDFELFPESVDEVVR